MSGNRFARAGQGANRSGEMTRDFGRILQALQVMHQCDDAIGSGGIERLRREGDAVAEFRLEHIPALI